MTEGQVWTIAELAAQAKVSDDTIRRRMKELNIGFTGRGRLIRITEKQAQKILSRVARFSTPDEK